MRGAEAGKRRGEKRTRTGRSEHAWTREREGDRERSRASCHHGIMESARGALGAHGYGASPVRLSGREFALSRCSVPRSRSVRAQCGQCRNLGAPARKAEHSFRSRGRRACMCPRTALRAQTPHGQRAAACQSESQA